MLSCQQKYNSMKAELTGDIDTDQNGCQGLVAKLTELVKTGLNLAFK